MITSFVNIKLFVRLLGAAYSLLIICSCQSKISADKNVDSVLVSEQLIDSLRGHTSLPSIYFDKYSTAREEFNKSHDDADALIWYGRRTAYLGLYKEAIDVFTEGVDRFPEDARMYRHRGHRLISLRRYDEAIEDFKSAVSLIDGKDDQVEPDGLPNDKNIPLSTLHGNIWYHLGLAYYLKNDLHHALQAFSNRAVTERYDDNIVSGGHWLYMINRRLGQNEAARIILEPITNDMDIIENGSYYKMCQFYKGLIEEEALQPEGFRSSSDDVLKYGLANWNLYHLQDTAKAELILDDLLENGNKFSFAYIAAEADRKRMLQTQESN